LCLTDPPYGINYKDKYKHKHKKSINYLDIIKFVDYLDWFKELKRICKGIIFTPGLKYLYNWIRLEQPKYILKFLYYFDNGAVIHYDPLLFYGKIDRFSYLRDVIQIKAQKYSGFLHTSPKSFEGWYHIVKILDPKSVIDPFMGSGTTAEVCTKLGIPWLGYEINEVYSQDINKRLKNCKKEPKQVKLQI